MLTTKDVPAQMGIGPWRGKRGDRVTLKGESLEYRFEAQAAIVAGPARLIGLRYDGKNTPVKRQAQSQSVDCLEAVVYEADLEFTNDGVVTVVLRGRRGERL